MSMPYRVKMRRASPVTSGKALQRIESADGQRWAYSRSRKRQLGGGRYEIVESWVCRARLNGKVITVHGDAFESQAREFCGLGAAENV